MPKRTLWLIGDWKQRDFAAAGRWLAGQPCRKFKSVTAAVSAAHKLGDGSRPEAVVIAQPRPGQVGFGEIEGLREALPQVNVVLLNGPWCEGEHRSSRAQPGVASVPWRRWRAGLESELERAAPNVVGSNGQDSKGIAAAELEAGLEKLASRQTRAMRAVVWTFSRSTFAFLSDALQMLGLEAEWLGGSGRFTGAADIIIYDGWESVLPIPGGRTLHAGRGTPRRAFPTRILLVNFPRPDDAVVAAAFGIDAVLPQPLLLFDLASAVDRQHAT